MKSVVLPAPDGVIESLRAGDRLSLSGVVYTARDAAHKRLCEMMDRGEPLPVELRGEAIFYAGPCPAPPGRPIGPIGPTTGGRMDAYSPRLIEYGIKVMIGKGGRSRAVADSIKKHRGIYLSAPGGIAALMAKCVTVCQISAFEDLGTEAVRRLEISGLPAVVTIDSRGEVFEGGGSIDISPK